MSNNYYDEDDYYVSTVPQYDEGFEVYDEDLDPFAFDDKLIEYLSQLEKEIEDTKMLLVEYSEDDSTSLKDFVSLAKKLDEMEAEYTSLQESFIF